MAHTAVQLSELPIFTQLSPMQQLLLHHAGKEVSFGADERLLAEGDPARKC